MPNEKIATGPLRSRRLAESYPGDVRVQLVSGTLRQARKPGPDS